MQRQFFGCEAKLSAVSTKGSFLKDREPLEELIEAQQASDIRADHLKRCRSWLL